ncbi:MAG: LD-carboxypeptidase [Bacteroidales bacterium]|nr:LD-carboxypeptidase [Bacteroidales bacterium]
MKRLESLQRGDTVTIVAPARKVSEAELRPAIEEMESWGLEVKLPKGIYGEENQFAGSDEERREMIQWALDEEEIKAVFCARGGYGTVRVIDRLDFRGLAERPKWIVGYSDVTVIHSHVNRHRLCPTLHATMPINVPEKREERDCPSLMSLKKMLFEGHEEYETEAHPLNRPGEAKAEVVGGNLSILYSLLGSPSDVDTEGKILLIEDLDEYLYHIDRMMQNLKRNGKLRGLKGLIVGGLTDMHDNTVPYGKTAEEIVAEAVAEYGYPVCYRAPFGHIGTENRALLLGGEMEMRSRGDGTFELKTRI